MSSSPIATCGTRPKRIARRSDCDCTCSVRPEPVEGRGFPKVSLAVTRASTGSARTEGIVTPPPQQLARLAIQTARREHIQRIQVHHDSLYGGQGARCSARSRIIGSVMASAPPHGSRERLLAGHDAWRMSMTRKVATPTTGMPAGSVAGANKRLAEHCATRNLGHIGCRLSDSGRQAETAPVAETAMRNSARRILCPIAAPDSAGPCR